MHRTATQTLDQRKHLKHTTARNCNKLLANGRNSFLRLRNGRLARSEYAWTVYKLFFSSHKDSLKIGLVCICYFTDFLSNPLSKPPSRSDADARRSEWSQFLGKRTEKIDFAQDEIPCDGMRFYKLKHAQTKIKTRVETILGRFPSWPDEIKQRNAHFKS